MYVKRNASKPPPEPSKEKKNLPKFEVVSKSTVLWKGPIFLHILLQWFQSHLLIFLLYYMLKTPPRCCGSFAQFKRNFSFPKKFCVLQIQSFEIWKKQYCIHYSSTFDILYYAYVLYVPCLQGKKFCSQVCTLKPSWSLKTSRPITHWRWMAKAKQNT